MAETKLLFANICLLLGFFICSVQSASFQFSDGEQTCILLDIDASFDLSMGEQKADPFNIDGANVTKTQSLCGTDTRSSLLSLKLFPSDETFKLNFKRESNTNVVLMSAVLTLEPKKHFENASDIIPFELETSQDLPVGVTNMSFICNSEQQMFFNQDPGFSMTMMITNLHVQAYNIENGEFSSADECEQDQFTTPPTTSPPTEPTTEVITSTEAETTTPETPLTLFTETTSSDTPTTTGPEVTTVTPNDNVTSPEPDTTSPTTEPETTTPTTEPVTTTPKKLPKYEVKQGDTVCIVIEGDIRFDISYDRNDGEKGVATINVPDNAMVSGNCTYDENNTTQELKLTFFEDRWDFSVLIGKDEENLLMSSGSLLRDLQAEQAYSWKSIELNYVIDERFENAKDSGEQKNIKKDDANDFRANVDGSYKCSTGESIQLEEDVTVDLANFKYKAFNTDDSGNFTANGVTACPADQPDDDDDDDDTVAIVLGAVFGSLAFILLVIGIGIFISRRKKNDYEVM